MMTNAKLVFFILLIPSYATNSANAVSRDHDVELEPPVTVTASSVADATSETIHHEVLQQRSLTKWRHEAFPNPERDAKACGSSRICDPDSILQEAEMNALEVRIEQLETSQTVACSDAKVPIEVAVALVQMVRELYNSCHQVSQSMDDGSDNSFITPRFTVMLSIL
jgi:hypothetical protein